MRVVLCVFLAVFLSQLQEGLSQQGDNLTLPLTQTTRALEGVENQVCPQDDIRELIQTTNNQEIDAKLTNLAPIVEPCNVKRYGRVAHCPATSCREIIEQSSAYPPSGYYWLNGSDGTVARVYCDMVRGVAICDESVGPNINCSEPLEPTSCPLGRTDSCPATNCSEIQQNDPSATSDYYWMQLTNGTITQVYCEMTPQCACSSATPYTRVAFVNMTDSSQQCPGDFMEVSNSRVRACGRQTTTSGSCNSATFSVLSMEYQHVCGRIVGWQIGHPIGFYGGNYVGQDIDGHYLDGISITYGGLPRQHIWSLAGTLTEIDTHDSQLCPCSNTAVSGATVPSFIGNDFFCETGIDYSFTAGLFYEDSDPLWDGEGCGSTSTCCEFNNPPWFCKQLPQRTSRFAFAKHKELSSKTRHLSTLNCTFAKIEPMCDIRCSYVLLQLLYRLYIGKYVIVHI